MNNLERSIMIYLQYDQKADDRFHNPMPENIEYHNRVKTDAINIAKIASDYFLKEGGVKIKNNK